MTRHKGKTAPKTGGSNGKKPPLTHFLCVPLVTASSRPQLEVSLARFRDQVAGIKSATSVSALEDYQPGTQGVEFAASPSGAKGLGKAGGPREQPVAARAAGAGATPAVPEKAVRPVGTLHLTLGVMSLDEERLTCAIELLHSIDTAELLKEVGLKGAKHTATPKAAESRLEDQDRGAAALDSTHITTISSLPAVNSSPTSASTPSTNTTPNPPLTLTIPISPPPITASVSAPVPTASPALLSITLESLHSMHSPSKTSILYAIPTDPTNRLHAFASRIRSLFTDADLVVLDNRPLKLHATIVNTIYAKKEGRKRPGRIADSSSNSATSKGSVADSITDARTEPIRGDQPPQQNDRAEGHGPHSRAPIRLDARELMDRYKDFVWAQDVAVEKVAVCKMGARKVVDEWGRVVDEVYEEVGSVAVVGR